MFFFSLFTVTFGAHGTSLAWHQIKASDVGLCHNQNNDKSKLQLQPTWQFMATMNLNPLRKARVQTHILKVTCQVHYRRATVETLLLGSSHSSLYPGSVTFWGQSLGGATGYLHRTDYWSDSGDLFFFHLMVEWILYITIIDCFSCTYPVIPMGIPMHVIWGLTKMKNLRGLHHV